MCASDIFGLKIKRLSGVFVGRCNNKHPFMVKTYRISKDGKIGGNNNDILKFSIWFVEGFKGWEIQGNNIDNKVNKKDTSDKSFMRWIFLDLL